MEYNHKKIEKKWQDYWDKNQTFYTDVWDFSKPKFYALDMFPYPSGAGLHVGHPLGYTASDVVSRLKRMQGFNVLHPMGFDSFGLPAEQYAIQTNNHPESFTLKNIEIFTNQLKKLGFSFDWTKAISTCDPKFYKWTQYIFKILFEDNLAKYVNMPVNWCEELGCVLANDEVIDGLSERGGYPVVKRDMMQWVLDIAKYAEKLLSGLDELDWPESTKEMQRNWIGKSQGANITFKIKDHDLDLVVFTTRPDTVFGATYCALAPEHPFVDKITTKEYEEKVKEYKNTCLRKSDIERLDNTKEKTGVFTGSYAINPLNNKLIPIYVADYVLISYGNGAIMAVPAHDQRDYEFAKKYNIDIIEVIENDAPSDMAYEGDGLHKNSGFLNGLDKKDSIEKMINYLEEHNIGNRKTTYRLREWIFARQRYWGEPIPVVHFDDEIVVLSDEELPLLLPPLDDFKPLVKGTAPLENAKEWIKYERDSKVGRRETNTMPGSAGSSFYFLRYIDPFNEKEIVDKKLQEHWMPVDLYIGGSEHAVGHLLYSRFWMKYLYEKGIVSYEEPFKKLVHQGMILGENNEKMSKSRGNVVNPDGIIDTLGADSLRLYEMFMGPLEASLPWSKNGPEGARKFLDRVWRLFTNEEYKKKFTLTNDKSLEQIFHKTVKKVTSDFENLNFNTAIAQMMIFINEVYKCDKIYIEYLKDFIKMLSCVAPHLCEEIWQLLGNENTIAYEKWPQYIEELTISKVCEVVIQVNGKIKDKLTINYDTSEEELVDLSLNSEKIKLNIEGKELIKTIVVKNKLVNFVVR